MQIIKSFICYGQVGWVVRITPTTELRDSETDPKKLLNWKRFALKRKPHVSCQASYTILLWNAIFSAKTAATGWTVVKKCTSWLFLCCWKLLWTQTSWQTNSSFSVRVGRNNVWIVLDVTFKFLQELSFKLDWLVYFLCRNLSVSFWLAQVLVLFPSVSWKCSGHQM